MAKPQDETGARVLILGCSVAKRSAQSAVPARDLYDGPAFRVLRRAPSDVPVYVLSGKHGLIEADRPIEPYDTLLAHDDALGSTVGAQIADLFGARKGEALAVMSDRYFGLLRAAWDESGTAMTLRAAPGPPGVRLAALRRWLHGKPAPDVGRTLRFQGAPITFDRADAEAAIAGAADFGRPAAWAVEVGGRLVPPKWLVARLTGVRASEFHTHEALRVLRGLGFEPQELTK